MSYFEHIPEIRHEGPQSDNPLAYRHYDKSKWVLGKTLEEHLRLAVCCWHRSSGRASTFSGKGRSGVRGSKPATRWNARCKKPMPRSNSSRSSARPTQAATLRSWNAEFGRKILSGDYSLSTLAADALARDLNPQHASGQQERMENIVNQAIYSGR